MCLITIVIPCYNSYYLEECLKSIIEQNYKDWKAIVVDDASTMISVADIVHKLSDKRITLLTHEKNMGPSCAKNTGIRSSRTRYFATLDSDDILSADFIQTLLAPLIDDDSYDCSFGDIRLFGDVRGTIEYQGEDRGDMTERQLIPGAGVIMKKRLWEEIGGYCEKSPLGTYNEDWDYWLSAEKVGFRPVHVPKILYYYRRSRNTLSSICRTEDYKSRELMYSRHRELFERHGSSDYFLYRGYMNSALAYKISGQFIKSIGLYAKAFGRSGGLARALYVLYESLIPGFIFNACRYLRAVIRATIKGGDIG